MLPSASSTVCAWALTLLSGLAQASVPAVTLGPLTNDTLTLTYEFALPQQPQDHASVNLPGCDILHRPGTAPVPFRTARVLLPRNSRLVSVDARPEGELRPVPGTFHFGERRGLARSRQPELASMRSESNLSGPGSQSLFSTLRWPTRAELIAVQRFLGRDIALIRLFPLRRSPEGPQLSCVSELKLTLTLAPAVDNAPTPLLPSDAPERIVSFVDNPAQLEPQPVAPQVQPATPNTRADYLLITKQDLLPAFAPLLRQKEQAGLITRSETVEAIQAREPGRDLPEKIRNFIRYSCTNSGVRFVLLGGDASTIPCRYAFVRMNEKTTDSLIPCDLYYACLDGSWNRDQDQRWGEPSDGEDGGDVDLLADVLLGRAPVDTPEETTRFVQKTLRAAHRPPHLNPGILVAAEYLGSFSSNPQAHAGKIFDPLLEQLGCARVTRLDDRPHASPQWGPAEALTALNQSPSLVLHHGHAESDTVLRLHRRDLDQLTNSQPFFFYSAGCYAGRFDNDPFSPDAVAEELITRTDHGAFAAVFNPRSGWFDPQSEGQFSGQFQLKFVEALTRHATLSLGAANQASKHAMIAHVESSGIMPYRWCYYEITLLGDPHTPIHLGQPPSK